MNAEKLLEVLTAPQQARAVLKQALDQGDEGAVIAALSHAEVPRKALRLALNSSRTAVRMAAQKALEGRKLPVRTPPQAGSTLRALRRDLESEDPQVRQQAQERLEARAKARQEKRPEQRAANPQTPVAELRRLAGHESLVVRRNAWLNPSLPPELLQAITLLELKKPLTPEAALELAASGPSLQKALLAKEGLEEQVYRVAIEHGAASLVASSAHVPAKVLLELARKKPSPQVSRLIAKNPNADPKVLLALSKVSDGRTKAIIAAHPALDPEQMKRFSADPDWEVREGLASNPRLSSASAEALGQATTSAMPLLLADQQVIPAHFLEGWSKESDAKLELKIATHPKTPATALERLADSPDVKVRRAVAAHFSTPADVLTTLAQNPDPFVQEAAKGGRLAKDDEFGKGKVARFLRRAALRQRDIPAKTLEELSESETDSFNLRLIASHPAFPEGKRSVVLEKAKVNSRRSRRGERRLLFEPAEYLKQVGRQIDELLNGQGQDYDQDAILELRTLATTGSTKQKVFLSQHPHPFVKEALATTPQLPREAALELGKDLHYRGLMEKGRPDTDPTVKVIEELDQQDAKSERVKESAYSQRLCTAPSVAVRRMLAQNPDCLADAVALLAKDQQPDVRKAVAGRGILDPETLAILAQDRDLDIRQVIASRTDLSPNAFLLLAKDPALVVRQQVATNPNTPPEVLEVCALDPAPEVRQGVASRKQLSTEVLRVLAKDSDLTVATTVWQAICADTALFDGLHSEFASSPLAEMRVRLAQHSSTAESVLICLAVDKNQEVVDTVFDREQLGLEVLKALATTPHLSVKKELLAQCAKGLLKSRGETPMDGLGEDAWQQVLVYLAQGTDMEILKGIITIQNLPGPVLIALVQRPPPREARDDIYRKVLFDKNSPVEALAKLLEWPEGYRSLAVNPRCTPQMLMELYRKGGHPLAEQLLDNPNTPAEVIQQLDQELSGFAWRLAVQLVGYLPVIRKIVQRDRSILLKARLHPNAPSSMLQRGDPHELSAQEGLSVLWAADWLVRSGVAVALRYLV